MNTTSRCLWVPGTHWGLWRGRKRRGIWSCQPRPPQGVQAQACGWSKKEATPP